MGNALRLLIIDASDVETELLVSELRRAYEVEYERVETKETMQAALIKTNWDLILGTYTLPTFSARQAVDVLAARRLDLPFLLIPSPIHERAVIAALKAGSNDFLVKGTFADLVSIIEQEMREAKKRRERGRAEKLGEELFGSAFQLSPVGICITGLDGTLLNTSQSLADMLGFTRAELEGKHFSDITYPADLDIGREAVGKMMSGQVPSVSFEKRYLHKSGEPIWALVSSSLLRDASGQPVHFITHILNITERKQAEQQISVQAARLEVLADASQTFATAVHNYQTMLEVVARQTAEVFDGSCSVRLLSEDREWLEMVAMHDVDPKALEIIRMLSSQPLRADEPNFEQHVLQSEQAFIMPGISEEQLRPMIKPEHQEHLKYVASQSRLLAPIRARGQTIGFLIIARKPGSPAFDRQELSLAQDLADRAALAITNAKLLKQAQNELMERKQVEVALRQSEQKYSVLFDKSSVPAALSKLPEGVFVDINEAFEKTYGYSKEDVIGKTSVELGMARPEERSDTIAKIQQRGSVHDDEKHIFTKSGELRIASINVGMVEFGGEQYAITTAHDITERKQVEEALSESQTRLAGIIDSAMDAIITIDEGQRITLFNPAAEHIFGYSAADVIGGPLDRLLPARFRSIHREHVRIFGETDITRRTMGSLGVLRGLRADGQEFPLESSISKLEAAGQKVYTVILRDITERIRAEKAAAESEARYQHVLDAMMEGCQIIDFDWRYLYVNDVVAAQGKNTREQLLHRTMMEVYPGIENTELFASLRQCMQDRTPTRLENQFLFPDGSVGWFELSIQPAQEGIFILSTDITERKRAEEKLQQSEARFSSAFYSSPIPITMTRVQDGQIVDVNDAWCTMLGYTREQALGRTPVELGITDAQARQTIMKTLEVTGLIRNVEVSIYTQEGENRDVFLSMETFELNEESHALTTLVDITERKQAEQALIRTAEELRRSNTELEQFAYVSSHDLQEPLRMVSSYVQLLAKRYKGKLDADADDFIGFAVEGATRMQQLINDLLAYSRVGTQGKPFAPTDFEVVLENVLDNLQIAIAESEAVITHDPLPTLMADHVQMIQLFQNLIGNAIKFRNQAPRVHVYAERSDKNWQFAVRDNGVGIDPQFAERVFIIFQRLHTRAEYAGTGIGLAICKKIIERHGGRIWVEPVPEQGSIFHFTIPDTGGQHDDKT